MSDAHNGFGQRVRKEVSGVSTLFVYDEAGHLLGEYQGNGTPIQEIVWLGDIPLAAVRPDGVYYIHTDHLNTPRQIEDVQGEAVWAWNDETFGDNAPDEDPRNTGTSFQFNLRMPGQYFDAETGLHYNYFRYYDPTTGRYVTSDPIGLAGGLNTYSYALQNPLIYFDHLGLVCRQTARRGLRCTPGPGRGGGRVGVFGCLAGCVSYTQGDSEAQASISPTLGGGLMLCSPKPEPEKECENKDPDPPKQDCGIYDPNCDNNAQPSVSVTRGGVGLGLARNADGSYCVLVGPFASYPLISPSINLGGMSE